MGNDGSHRGRIQAQGGKVEKSCNWDQATPLTAKKGRELVQKLKNQLTPSQLREREESFKKVDKYITRAANAGGVDAPVSKSFLNFPKTDSKIRVDIEVITGKAFVPDPDDVQVQEQ
ncbi:hypothetical protein [Planktothrix mougeotii]|jgi:hypothetical protein|uniref:Uncharacterized protein n=1 Tax=Planktothrix mougeotii LEGE 06226 TaxID=1828728 RepID=A0ABR9U709_9CYAN|nr:hypothetical protein [Planktothrix mougeotii]MBE9142245.1 hypothetical protein [Planktothrix mougeotii LEGE 06226]